MPYKLALISKYPPLEGGIAAKTYWLARGLAARGHEVLVLTHAESAGGKYRIPGNSARFDFGVRVHRAGDGTPWHVPEDPQYALALLERAVAVIQDDCVQLIDSGYLVPYGIVGGLAKRIACVSHVLRHGGSDVEKFLKRGVLGRLLEQSIREADLVITETQYAELLDGLGGRAACQLPYVPDGEAFAPRGGSSVRGRVAFIGKINYHWRYKRLDAIAAIMALLAGEFECWIVGQGNGLDGFRAYVGDSLAARLRWHPFVHPGEMPDLLGQIDAVFALESALPYPMFSNLAVEALCTGVGVITDRADFANTYRLLVTADEDHILTVPSQSPERAADAIRNWLIGRRRLPVPKQLTTFNQYLQETESSYQRALN